MLEMRMTFTQNLNLTSIGCRLDTSPEAFGELRDSSYLAGDGEALRTRMAEDGYLFLRGYLKRDEVLAARREIVERMAKEGALEPGTAPMDAILAKGRDIVFPSRPDDAKCAAGAPALQRPDDGILRMLF